MSNEYIRFYTMNGEAREARVRSLVDLDFDGADLRAADFRGKKFGGANFADARLGWRVSSWGGLLGGVLF
jgi:uncharacterized protein YjbI with pentapeptide repeats